MLVSYKHGYKGDGGKVVIKQLAVLLMHLHKMLGEDRPSSILSCLGYKFENVCSFSAVCKAIVKSSVNVSLTRFSELYFFKVSKVSFVLDRLS